MNTKIEEAFARYGITVEAIDLSRPGGLNQRAGEGQAILISEEQAYELLGHLEEAKEDA